MQRESQRECEAMERRRRFTKEEIKIPVCSSARESDEFDAGTFFISASHISRNRRTSCSQRGFRIALPSRIQGLGIEVHL